MFVLNAILHALQISLFMLWEVFWPLAFGFLLSAIVQTVVSKRAVASVLGKPDFKGFVLACGFGAASSSCSYASVAVARALFRRGRASSTRSSSNSHPPTWSSSWDWSCSSSWAGSSSPPSSLAAS